MIYKYIKPKLTYPTLTSREHLPYERAMLGLLLASSVTISTGVSIRNIRYLSAVLWNFDSLIRSRVLPTNILMKLISWMRAGIWISSRRRWDLFPQNLSFENVELTENLAAGPAEIY